MSILFSPWRIRDVTLRNRVVMAPMSQYSAVDGIAQPWHLVHLGSRAAGGCGMVMAEATAISPEARVTPGDLGLWSGRHAEALAPVAAFIRSQKAVPAIQLYHGGRKVSTDVPWRGRRPIPPEEGGWRGIGPLAEAFEPGMPEPHRAGEDDFERLADQFVQSARLALEAGFDVLELHFAHGYLLQAFLSPLSNRREDGWGGASLENRWRFPLHVARKVREAWPEKLPLFVRISVTDWQDGGWELEQSVALAVALKEVGVDLIDCSSGGPVAGVKMPRGPGFLVPFAAEIRRRAQMPTSAVGFISSAAQAEQILAHGQADLIFLGKALLRDPHWALHAAHELGVPAPWPDPYDRMDVNPLQRAARGSGDEIIKPDAKAVTPTGDQGTGGGR